MVVRPFEGGGEAVYTRVGGVHVSSSAVPTIESLGILQLI